jgi:hypothetical protein
LEKEIEMAAQPKSFLDKRAIHASVFAERFDIAKR